jgi:pseudouridine kinase
MTETGYVLVIGSAGVDIKGRPNADLEWNIPNLGRIRNSVGGVARNIAENLARLEISTVLLTAVGKDAAGRRVIRACERAGINCHYVRYIPTGRTGTYMALLRPNGQLHVAISDFEIIDQADSDYLIEHEYLIENAAMIVIDATLTDETLATVFALTEHYGVPVVADPTNPTLAGKLRPYLAKLYMVVPNASETEALCGHAGPAGDYEAAVETARSLVQMGVHYAVVTMGEHGLAYAHSGGSGYIKAVHTKVVDTTGAGDAFSGAAIFGLLNEVPIDEAMRLGITAASLTLESRHTVLSNLSQELLYDKLTV